MGLLDNMKAKLGPAKGKVSDLAQRHGDKIDKVEHGLDRAAKVVDEKTKGKYSDRIQRGTGRAKDAMDRLAHKGGPEAETGGTTPPAGPGVTPPTGPGTTPPAGPPPTS
ncbi:antitoxin [Streptomyces sp. S.PNR 29]|uniref:antitoxin n=1 Tax=Streptomyces sp. S.PNR 29 TaxID=2973805 RepID=UPI0025AF166F|nr:antitoxin [Streptomyces sp. S.PNR 29]MDN0197558.1 antitoxin [Streptomyces sp. S.PNR 29]